MAMAFRMEQLVGGENAIVLRVCDGCISNVSEVDHSSLPRKDNSMTKASRSLLQRFRAKYRRSHSRTSVNAERANSIRRRGEQLQSSDLGGATPILMTPQVLLARQVPTGSSCARLIRKPPAASPAQADRRIHPVGRTAL